MEKILESKRADSVIASEQGERGNPKDKNKILLSANPQNLESKNMDCHDFANAKSRNDNEKDSSAQIDCRTLPRKNRNDDKADSKADTTELESQIDSLIYKLYNLTEAEIKKVKQG